VGVCISWRDKWLGGLLVIDLMLSISVLIVVFDSVYRDLKISFALKNDLDAMELKLMELRK
jgi:hypothetical protein